jgi:hypothetical protein
MQSTNLLAQQAPQPICLMMILTGLMMSCPQQTQPHHIQHQLSKQGQQL